jgi:hypothetical protein
MTMLALLVALTSAQADRPTEDSMFGGPPASPPPIVAPDMARGPDGGLEEPKVRPTEEELFGGPQPPAAAAEAQQLHPDAGMTRDEQQLNDSAIKNRFDTEDEKTNPLTIGGTLYLRAQTTFQEKTSFNNSQFSSPDLLDVYLDARPNDRVRGVAVGRLLYDPTLGNGTSSTLNLTSIGSSTIAQQTGNPVGYLDQLYLKFDIAHTVFVTAGRQKIKWGTSHIWNPTDALNSQKRDPLQPFDLRLGVNAVKVHIPVEKLGWNFYAYGLLDNSAPANTLGKLGGAARAEFVIPGVKAELGLDGAWVIGRRPRYGIDLSLPFPDPIPVDFYGEIAFRSAHDFTQWSVNGTFDPNNPLGTGFTANYPTGVTAQASFGLSSTFPYNDKNTATVGMEYFFNPMGVDQPIYPWLILQGTYTAFYAAKHYAGLFATFAGLPELTWVTLSFTGLMNITDLSALARVDAFFRVLEFLQFEAFVSGNFGNRGGELKFQLPPLSLPGGIETPNYPAPIASCGVGLRISI